MGRIRVTASGLMLCLSSGLLASDLAAAKKWPAVFKNPLCRRAEYPRLHYSLGQYGGAAILENNIAMRVRGIHTTTAVWVPQPLSRYYMLSCGVGFTDSGAARIWLAGPGHGNSERLGYCLGMDRRRSVLMREGKPVSAFKMPAPVDLSRFYRVTALRDDHHIEVIFLILFEII